MRLGLLQYDDYMSTATWLAVFAFCAFAVGYTLARSQTPSTGDTLRLRTVARIGVSDARESGDASRRISVAREGNRGQDEAVLYAGVWDRANV